MKKLLFAACCSVLCLGSCTTLYRTANIAQGVNGDAVINPITANVDLEHMAKIQGRSKSTFLLCFRLKGDRKYLENPGSLPLFTPRIEKVRTAALYNALEDSGDKYDVLIRPIYRTEVHKIIFGLVKTYTVTVEGYGTNITEMKQVQPGELDYDTLLDGARSRKVRVLGTPINAEASLKVN